MYTQCPDCQTAFRVTVPVLQKAAGRVRCGGCGNAFSALDYLSEEMPSQQMQEVMAVAASGGSIVHELREQSEELLASLDELTGSDDVRIEDTGVEWRVLTEDEDEGNDVQYQDSGVVAQLSDRDGIDPLDDSGSQTALDLLNAGNVGERRYDDNTPLPDDFEDEDDIPFTPQRRASDEAPQRRSEDVDGATAELDGSQVDLELGADGDWDDLLEEAEPQTAAMIIEDLDVANTADDMQVADSAVTDPVTIPVADLFDDDDEIEETTEAPISDEIDEQDRDDTPDTSASGSIPADIDTQFNMQALAMGLDITQNDEFDADASHNVETIDEHDADEAGELDMMAEQLADSQPEESAVIDLSDEEGLLSEEDLDALALIGDDSLATTEQAEEGSPEVEADYADIESDEAAQSLNIETGNFDEAVQTAAEYAVEDAAADSLTADMNNELAENDDTLNGALEEFTDYDDTLNGALEEVADNDDTLNGALEEVAEPSGIVEKLRESTGAFQAQIEAAQQALDNGEVDEYAEAEPAPEDDAQHAKLASDDDDPAAELAEDAEPLEQDTDPTDDAALTEFELSDEEAATDELEGKSDEENIAIASSDALALVEDESVDLADVPTRAEDHVVPTPTEEELSINEEIDRELLNEDTSEVDILSQTMIQAGIDPSTLDIENVETIVMEGDFVRGSLERERLADDNQVMANFDDPTSLADTYMLNKGKLRGGRRKTDPVGAGFVAVVVILALLLAAQYIHGSRETLASIGAFNHTLGTVYRVLGSPVVPNYDVRGWQFQKTQYQMETEGGDSGPSGLEQTTETDNVTPAGDAQGPEVLSIISRIRNESSDSLPYPLIYVTLTDNYDEEIGSMVLNSRRYLAGSADTSISIAPGEEFQAVIAIRSPAAETAGFRLNLCYPNGSGQLRCAMEDFKD